ncbi:MAG TPA: GlsB/YeaQ/YmgE family stress response membrane protein [Blastocatellia bacterium]|nr:GlsB/YeaQ/YmgE family stress response membrane protein [Blastocatellia bacterium]
MSLTQLLILLLVSGICGSIGRAIAGYSHGGCLVSIALGFIGAIIGVWLADALHLPHLFFVRVGDESFPIIWSIIGSALFVAVISFLTRRR